MLPENTDEISRILKGTLLRDFGYLQIFLTFQQISSGFEAQIEQIIVHGDSVVVMEKFGGIGAVDLQFIAKH